jgi:hypothetical protein
MHTNQTLLAKNKLTVVKVQRRKTLHRVTYIKNVIVCSITSLIWCKFVDVSILCIGFTRIICDGIKHKYDFICIWKDDRHPNKWKSAVVYPSFLFYDEGHLFVKCENINALNNVFIDNADFRRWYMPITADDGSTILVPFIPIMKIFEKNQYLTDLSHRIIYLSNKEENVNISEVDMVHFNKLEGRNIFNEYTDSTSRTHCNTTKPIFETVSAILPRMKLATKPARSSVPIRKRRRYRNSKECNRNLVTQLCRFVDYD